MSDENVQAARDRIAILSKPAAGDIECPMHLFRLPGTAEDRPPFNLDPCVLEACGSTTSQKSYRVAGVTLGNKVVIGGDGSFVRM